MAHPIRTLRRSGNADSEPESGGKVVWLGGRETGPLEARRGGRPEIPSPLSDSRPSAELPGEGPFTAYIRAFEHGAPADEHWQLFWPALLDAVQRELSRRGLWTRPPTYLGIEAAVRWDRRSLRELATDCYLFLLRRLRSLKQQLKVKENVDGLVVLNVRHFIHERQKQCDPLGFRIYEILRLAVREAVSEGEIEVVDGDPAIDNQSLLRLNGHQAADDGIPLDELTRSWGDELLPELVTAYGRQRSKVVARLRARLPQLRRLEDDEVVFKDLLDGLKRAVRVRWEAIWAESRGETGLEEDSELAALVPITWPRSTFEDRQSFQRLVVNVTAAMERAGRAPSPGEAKDPCDALWALWRFLVTWAPDAEKRDLPSGRRLAEILDIPRYRLPALFGELQELIQEQDARQSPGESELPLPEDRDRHGDRR